MVVSNIRLENNDLIVVGPYTNRVTIEGAVKIPGKFETKNDETLATCYHTLVDFLKMHLKNQLN
jgi:protein involved in polysaccharide export with SLBB domain